MAPGRANSEREPVRAVAGHAPRRRTRDDGAARRPGSRRNPRWIRPGARDVLGALAAKGTAGQRRRARLARSASAITASATQPSSLRTIRCRARPATRSPKFTTTPRTSLRRRCTASSRRPTSIPMSRSTTACATKWCAGRRPPSYQNSCATPTATAWRSGARSGCRSSTTGWWSIASGCRPRLLLSNAVTKVILRDAMRGIVPDRILDRKDKLAYAPPQRQWTQGPLRPWIEQMLMSAERRTNVFNPVMIRRIREKVRAGGNHRLAWRVASTEAWLQSMVDKSAGARSSRAIAASPAAG